MKLKEDKLTEIRNSLEALLTDLETASGKGTHLHEVEGSIFRHLLCMGFKLLEYYVLLASRLVLSSGCPIDSSGKKYKNTGNRVRAYMSIFGLMKISRPKYYSAIGKTYYALDAWLGLPEGRYSYILSDWLAYGSVEMDFAQSANQLERILGHQLTGMQASRQTYHREEHVDAFYGQQDWADLEDGSHLSVGYDGKGIPIMRSQTDRKGESASARLAKGKKKGVRREATISVSSSFTPKPRSKEDILSSLFLAEKASAKATGQHQWHEQKHIRAFLSDKPRAIGYGLDNLLARDRTGQKPIIVLIDGDRALELAVRAACEKRQVAHRVDAYILDFIHLLGYVWQVANAYLGENSPDRDAWVCRQAELLLDSRHEEVLKGWMSIKETCQLSKNRLYNLERAIKYVSNRPHMIDYKAYLSKGYPITTGAVESACGHFIKSRMDRNAMHWGWEGAQRMLNIRAIKKNQNWEQYMDYFIEQEQNDLYKNVA